MFYIHPTNYWFERSACASGANVVAIINGVIFSSLSPLSFWALYYSPRSRLATVLKFCMGS